MPDTNHFHTFETAQNDGTWRMNAYTAPERLASIEIIPADDVLSLNPIPTGALTTIPSHFPTQIAQIIEPIPFVKDGTALHNMRQTAVSLISAVFCPESPDKVALLQQIAAFLDYAPSGFSQNISRLLSSLISTTICLDPGDEFTIRDLLDSAEETWVNQFIISILAVPDVVSQDIFGYPISGTHIVNMFAHIWVTVVAASSPSFDIELEDCSYSCYKPKPTKEVFQRFMDSLPKVSVDSLEVDARECGICREPYAEVIDDREPEEAVKLPCGHVLGKACLTVMIESWHHRTCPLCRRSIALLPKTPLSDFLGL